MLLEICISIHVYVNYLTTNEIKSIKYLEVNLKQVLCILIFVFTLVIQIIKEEKQNQFHHCAQFFDCQLFKHST